MDALSAISTTWAVRGESCPTANACGRGIEKLKDGSGISPALTSNSDGMSTTVVAQSSIIPLPGWFGETSELELGRCSSNIAEEAVKKEPQSDEVESSSGRVGGMEARVLGGS